MCIKVFDLVIYKHIASTVSFYKINFNGRRAVVKFAKDYIRTCIKATQMPTHICIVLHILAQHDTKIFNTVDILERIAI